MMKYYHCKFLQEAPLSLSNGDGEMTDRDLMTDLQGRPFIPGSSLAGVLRDMLGEREGDLLFGSVTANARADSRVLVSDAVLPVHVGPQDVRISHRDGVGLTEFGTSKKTAKYDFQVVESRLPYTAVLELDCEENDEADVILRGLMENVAANGISFGAKTTRGYGRMSAEVTCVTFDLRSERSLREWIAYDPLEGIPASASGTEIIRPQSAVVSENELHVTARLKFSGAFTVRVYSAKNVSAQERGNVNAPKSAPLKNMNDRPVIPGTSWAGVFRHHMLSMMDELGLGEAEKAAVNEAFGVTDGQTKSRVYFSETAVGGGTQKTVMRVAVERFTAAPKKQGLFSSAIWCGGEGVLDIRLRQYDRARDSLTASLLLQCVRDLHLGLIGVGGEGGVGRGTAEVTGFVVNGKDLSPLLTDKQTSLDLEVL